MAATLPSNCYGNWKGAKGESDFFRKVFMLSVKKLLEFLEGFEISVPRMWAITPLWHFHLKKIGVYLGFTLR